LGAMRRGEVLLEALCMLKGRDGVELEAGVGLAGALAGRHGLAGRIGRALEDRSVAVDDAQREYMLALLGVDAFEDVVEEEGGEGGVEGGDVEGGEGGAGGMVGEKTPLIRQVEEVLPGMYGAGFLAACLDAFGDSPERVVDALLVGGVPAGLEAVDPQLDLDGYLATLRREHGEVNGATNGKAKTEEFPELAGTAMGKAAGAAAKKKNADKVTSRFLDTVESSYKDRLRSSIVAAQWEEQEYDDEYDDTYDDEVVKGPQDGGEPDLGGAGASAGQHHGATKKAQKLWVLDGLVYNYPKHGAQAVASRAEADAVLAEQKLSKLEIHGLGPQGNKHVAVAPDPNAASKPKAADPRRRHAGKEKHKAAIGNHHRKDRAATKQARAGGP